MRISDWSSDVCSSDLRLPCRGRLQKGEGRHLDRNVAEEHRRRLGLPDRLQPVALVDRQPREAVSACEILHRHHRDRKTTRLNSSHYCASRMPYADTKKQLHKPYSFHLNTNDIVHLQ